MDRFINTSLNHMSIRSNLASQPNNNLVSNSEQLFNAMDLSPINFCISSLPNPREKNLTNSQINSGTIK